MLSYEFGVHMGLIRQKKRGQKSRATVPLTLCFISVHLFKKSHLIGNQVLST
jgi:hypothetical protein